MPAREVVLIRLNTDIGEPAEIDRNHSCDVGDGELLARDEAAVGEFTIEPLEAFQRILFPNRGVLRALADASFEKLMLQAKRIGNWP